MTSDTHRLCALSDGVYAIVITILVLDLQPPESLALGEAPLAAHLVAQIPHFIAYLVSFSTIALFWLQHHWLLGHLERCDRATLALNFLHIFCLTLIPYSASVVGRYYEDRVAVILFAASLGLAGASLALLHQYVQGKDEWLTPAGRAALGAEHWLVRHRFVIFALVSIGVSFVSVRAAVLVWLACPIIAILARR